MSFKFIDALETTPSSADATALEDNDLDFGTVNPLGYKVLKFKIGNDNLTKKKFTITADGDSVSNGVYIYEGVHFTTNRFYNMGTNITYADVITWPTTIDITLEPNEISHTIWAVFACSSDYYYWYSGEVKLCVAESAVS